MLPGALSQAVSSFEYPSSYVQAIMEKTAGMPLYIEKMVEFLDQQRIEGADTGLDCRRGYGPGFGSRTGGPVDLMLHNISLQQVCRGQQGGMHVCAPTERGVRMCACHQSEGCACVRAIRARGARVCAPRE